MTGVLRWRRFGVAFVLLGGVGLALSVGGIALGVGFPRAAQAWLAAARGPWALPAAILAFAALAFVGAPQFVLIGAAVAVFGPIKGMVYSWIGSMVSAGVGFWLGRLGGARLLGGEATGVTRGVVDLIARNGFMASFVVRLVPFAPFLVVNIGAGLSGMSPWTFFAGTGLGIIPKIWLTGAAGGAVLGGSGGERVTMTEFALVAVAVWFAIGWAARKWLAARR